MHRFTALALCLAAASANAATTISFEGFQDTEMILNAYNGGTGSLGTAISNSGIIFSPDFQVGNDSDITSNVGFWGDTAYEPDGMGSMYVYSPINWGVIDVPAGFTTQWSTFYSAKAQCRIDVWGGPGGTGPLLGWTVISPNAQVNGGDPNGTFNTWKVATIPFAGTAMSVTYSGQSMEVRFDRMDFGKVPTPGAASLGLLGGLTMLRRKR